MKINKIYCGNCIDVLRTFPDKSVNCCITSPPYYGLRDYGTGIWVGGDLNCDHKIPLSEHDPKRCGSDSGSSHVSRFNLTKCYKCGAKRIDSQIGLEKTPKEYIDNLVNVFHEVKRVLTDDGVLWVNIGDTYNGNKKGNTEIYKNKNVSKNNSNINKKVWKECKPKDLIGIPWMLAFALRDDGWYLRQDIIWDKPNAMPEPVKDRCVKSHEYIFLLSKNKKYYFDYKSIKEPAKYAGDNRGSREDSRRGTKMNSMSGKTGEYRNKRDVWHVNTKPFKEAHFAAFPDTLIEPCVLSGCPEGGIVLDPFIGAGTTGIVSKRNNRNYVGIELNSDYIKIAENRINNVT